MSTIVSRLSARDHVVVNRRFLLRWDAAYEAFVLVHPDATIKLNDSAAEILQRCDGSRCVAEIIVELQDLYADAGGRIETGVYCFLELAYAKGWIETG